MIYLFIYKTKDFVTCIVLCDEIAQKIEQCDTNLKMLVVLSAGIRCYIIIKELTKYTKFLKQKPAILRNMWVSEMTLLQKHYLAKSRKDFLHSSLHCFKIIIICFTSKLHCSNIEVDI